MNKNLHLVAKIITLSFVFALSALFLQPAFAQPANSIPNKAGSDTLNFLDSVAQRSGLQTVSGATGGQDATLKIVGNIINVILGFVGIVFFVQLFWAGIRWMTSSGNEEIIKEAKGTIKTAIIGIVVVFSAFVITNFTLNQVEKITKTQATPPSTATAP